MTGTGRHDTRAFARGIRSDALRMTHRAKAPHIGSCLSAADILAVLFGRVLRLRPDDPGWLERDRFILSKGHAAAILYASLASRGFFPGQWLDHYCENEQPLAGHVTGHGIPGIEASTGSLGHGLALGLGMALAIRHDARTGRVVVLLSDGECDEGSVWESALLAGHLGTDNLIALIDYNKIQSFGHVDDVMPLEPFRDKWRAFGWEAREVDGHDHEALTAALTPLPLRAGRPSVFICHTVKGRGVSFMENRLLWHYRPPSDEELARALLELEGE